MNEGKRRSKDGRWKRDRGSEWNQKFHCSSFLQSSEFRVDSRIDAGVSLHRRCSEGSPDIRVNKFRGRNGDECPGSFRGRGSERGTSNI